MKKYGKIFMNGIIDENPTFRMVLGMCPTLAITTAASNGIGMGLAVTFVLIFSNLVISLLRKAIPDQIRIPAFIVVIATCAGCVSGRVHSADRRQLHHLRPRGSVRFQEQAAGLCG